MDFVKDKANKVTESFQGKTAEAKAEEDKKVIGSGASLSDQGTAVTELVKDKKDQKSHEGKADLYNAKAENR